MHAVPEWVLAMLLLTVSCRPSEEVRADAPQKSAAKSEAANPFAKPIDPSILDENGACVHAVLAFEDVAKNESLRGTFTVENRCALRLAVLTTPVELRIRKERGEFFHWEGMAGPFARLYIYRRDIGRPRLLGDAGARVLGLPTFVTVEARSSATYPIDGSVGLPPGEYGAYLQTWAAPAGAVRVEKGQMTLTESLKRHNARNAGTPELPTAQSFIGVHSPDDFFVVR